MKTWTEAEIKELQINETAFGLQNPENPDSEKTLVVINGVEGWEQEFGESDKKVQ